MILKQFYLNCLAHASYLVGDEQSRHAAIVDPQRDVEQYLACRGEHGLRITHVVLTHLHADFLAGHLELRDRDRGDASASAPRPRRSTRSSACSDGDCDRSRPRPPQALETPGHTPESISLLVFDLDESDTHPHAVLTGDTLFVGDVGRPDLRAALGWSAARSAACSTTRCRRSCWRCPTTASSTRRTAPGRSAARRSGKETFSTIGEQRRSNYALQPMSREAFVDIVTADQPDAPAYFTYDAVLNAKERPTLDESLAAGLKPLPLEQVLERQRARRADPRHARAGGVRGVAPGRQPEHRPRRPVRDVGRHHAQPASGRS